MEKDLFYWFYSITPQVFAALIAALGMVGVYKLTMLNEDAKTYAQAYSIFIEGEGCGRQSLTFNYAVKHCKDHLRSYDVKSAGYNNFAKQDYYLAQIISHKTTLLRHIFYPSSLCFFLVMYSYFFLSFNISSYDWIKTSFFIIALAIIWTGWAFFKIITLPLDVQDKTFAEAELIITREELRKKVK